jgi:hypothetical protein
MLLKERAEQLLHKHHTKKGAIKYLQKVRLASINQGRDKYYRQHLDNVKDMILTL